MLFGRKCGFLNTALASPILKDLYCAEIIFTILFTILVPILPRLSFLRPPKYPMPSPSSSPASDISPLSILLWSYFAFHDHHFSINCAPLAPPLHHYINSWCWCCRPLVFLVRLNRSVVPLAAARDCFLPSSLDLVIRRSSFAPRFSACSPFFPAPCR